MNKNRQSGYVLTDALIAAVIAAGVFVSAAQSLGVAARSSRAAQDYHEVVAQAEMIAARVDAGLTQDQWLDGLPDWSVEISPFEIDAFRNARSPKFQRLSFQYLKEPSFSFDRIISQSEAS